MRLDSGEAMNGYGSKKRSKIRSLEDINGSEVDKIPTGIREVDHVLDGGLVKGNIYLLAADAGVGKSTLTIQILHKLSENYSTLFISAEESLQKIKSRAERLNLATDKIGAQYSSSLPDILDDLRMYRPDFVVIDSIQAISDPEVKANPGQASQVKRCTQEITNMAKTLGIAVILICQFNKDKSIAGPKAMEHIIDVTLRMDRDTITGQTMLSCKKNRSGSTENIGLLKMTEAGLVETSYDELLNDKSNRMLIPLLENGMFSIVEIDCEVNFGKAGIICDNIQASHVKRVLQCARKATGYDFSKLNINIRASEPIDKDEVYTDFGIFAAIYLAYTLRSPNGFLTCGKMNFDGSVESNETVEKIVSYCIQSGIKKMVTPSDREFDSFIRIKNVGEYIELMEGWDA